MRPYAPVAALVVLLAGCGGGDSPPQTAAEFRTQIDGVCKATLDSAGDIRNGSLTGPKLAADLTELLDKLRDVEAPDEVAAGFQDWLRLLELERAALAVGNGDRGALLERQANDASARIGLDRCRQPPFERNAPK